MKPKPLTKSIETELCLSWLKQRAYCLDKCKGSIDYCMLKHDWQVVVSWDKIKEGLGNGIH